MPHLVRPDGTVVVLRGEEVIRDMVAAVEPLHEFVPLSRITALAQPYAPVCGVYFLFKDRELVYVGLSKNHHYRVHLHRLQKVIDFDSVTFVQASPQVLADIEAEYICRFQPKYNQQRKSRNPMKA